MSAAQSFAPAPATAAFARAPVVPDPPAEPDEKQRAHVAPVARLYRHALESVFAFLSLADLSCALRVSRSWSAAVRSMGSIHAAVTNSHPALIAVSSLALHVSRLDLADALSSSDLLVISRFLGSLTALSCTVELPHPTCLFFGPSLQTLAMGLRRRDEDETAHIIYVNDAIVTISRLPTLTDLALELSEFDPELDMAPFAAAAQLQSLTLDSTEVPVEPTHRQLDQLRTLSHLRKMAVPRLSLACLAYLLRAPHSLQWQELHTVWRIHDTAAAALSTLPTLTTLATRECRSVAFLSSLTCLRVLALCMDETVPLAADIVAGLAGCPQLTELTLEAEDVTASQLSQAISHLPLLRLLHLYICPALQSLSFLSECTHLAQSLQSLRLCDCRNSSLHSTELKHILTLKNLTSLGLSVSFVDSLDDSTLQQLQPPSVKLAKLEHFLYGDEED